MFLTTSLKLAGRIKMLKPPIFLVSSYRYLYVLLGRFKHCILIYHIGDVRLETDFKYGHYYQGLRYKTRIPRDFTKSK